MIFERLTVVVREGVVGRPERTDLSFWFANGEEHTGPTISPSGVSKFQGCNYKWGLYAIAKIPQKEKPAAEQGKLGHSYLEDWLLHKKNPPPTAIGTRLIASGALEEFPRPGSPGLTAEDVFAFVYSPTDDPEDMVVYWGYKDCERPGFVWDLKTTGDLCWAKNEQELFRDPQANIYAADNILQSGFSECTCKWVYVTTKGKTKKHPVQARLNTHNVLDTLNSFHAEALRMTRARAEGVLRAEDLPRDPTHCSAFGGCDYWDVCKGEMRRGSALRALRQQDKLAAQRKEDTMSSALDKIKASMAAAGKTPPQAGPPVNVSKPPAKAPAAPPKAAAAPPAKTPAKAPAVVAKTTAAPAAKPGLAGKPMAGRLAAAVGSVGKTPPKAVQAKGVTPPDAPEATADGDEEEGLAEGEEGEEGEEEAEEEAPPPPKKTVAKAAPAKAPATKPAPPKAPAKKAPEPEPEVEEEPEQEEELAAAGFTLLINVRNVKGPAPLSLEDYVTAARNLVEEEAGIPYRLIDFGKGPATLAAQLAALFDEHGVPSGVYSVDTTTFDREVLAVLAQYATVVLQG